MIAYGGRELANAFRTVRGNTLLIAEEIPEDKYSFVPVEDARSVGAQLAHIAMITAMPYDMHQVKRITTVIGYDFPGIITKLMADEQKPRTKAELIQLLREDGDRFAKWLETLTPEFLGETFTDHTGANPRTRFESLMSAKEHEMHHRGQLMLMQRMLGIVPHLTRQRMERMAGAAATAKAGA